MRGWTLSVVAAAALLVSCGSGGAEPHLERVSPEAVAPGGSVMITGRGLDRIASATIGGRRIEDLTTASATFVTGIAASDTPAGEQPLELITTGGRRVMGSVRVADARAVAGVGPAAPLPPPTLTPPPTPPPPPSPSVIRALPQPAPAAPGQRRDDDRDDEKEKEDKKKDEQRGGRGR